MSELVKGNFRLDGHIDVPTDRISEVKAALEKHIELTRSEPGCIFFNVDPCPDVAGRFLVSEAFVDGSAFEAHQARAGDSEWAIASKDVPRDYKTWVVE